MLEKTGIVQGCYVTQKTIRFIGQREREENMSYQPCENEEHLLFAETVDWF